MYGALTDSTVVSRVFKDVSQTAVPFALTVRIACPAGQVPVTRFCLLLTAAAVALKFWFTSSAVAGVPGTKVLGIVRSADQSGEAKTNEPKTKQRTAFRRVTLRIASMNPS